MTECCEGRKHLFHCCLMRYLSPVAFQKHLNAHMIEGMLGLHTVCLHYYPGISKLMHFTKKLAWRRREEIHIFSSACLQVLKDNLRRKDRSEKFKPRLASRHPVLLCDTALAARVDTPVFVQKCRSPQPREPISWHCNRQARAKHQISAGILFEPHR